jgi:hypothetical protein
VHKKEQQRETLSSCFPQKAKSKKQKAKSKKQKAKSKKTQEKQPFRVTRHSFSNKMY